MPGCFCFGKKKKKQKSLNYDVSSENNEYIYEKLYIAKRSARGREGKVYDNERSPNLSHQNFKHENTSPTVRPIFELSNTQKQLKNKSKSYPPSPKHLRYYLKKHEDNILLSKGSTVPFIYTAHLLNCKKPCNSQHNEKAEAFCFQKSTDYPYGKISYRKNNGGNADNGDCTPQNNIDKPYLNPIYQNKEKETINNLCSDPSKYVTKTNHSPQGSTIQNEMKNFKLNTKPTNRVMEESGGKTDTPTNPDINLNYERKENQDERVPQNNNYTSEENLKNVKNENKPYGCLKTRGKKQCNKFKIPVKAPEMYTVCNAEFSQNCAKQFNYNNPTLDPEKLYRESEEVEDKSGMSDIPLSTSDEFSSKNEPVATYAAHPYENSGFVNRRNTRYYGRRSLAHNPNADPNVNRHRETRNSDIAEGMMNTLLSSRNPNPPIPRKGYRMSTEYDVLSSDRRRQSVTREKDFLINVGKGQHLPPTQDELVTDILNTYSSIFVENLKDPIPKDPLNKPKAYNIVPPPRQPQTRKKVTIEQKQISTSKRKSTAFKQHMPDHMSTQEGYIPSAVGGQPRKSIARPRVSSARQTIMHRRTTAYPNGGRRRTVLVMPPEQQGYVHTDQSQTPPRHYESRPLTPNREYAEPRKSVARPRYSSARMPVYHRPTSFQSEEHRRTTLFPKSVNVRPNSNPHSNYRRQTIILPGNQHRQTIADGRGKLPLRRPTTVLTPHHNLTNTTINHMPHTPGGRLNTHQVYTVNIPEVDFSKINKKKQSLYKKGSNPALLRSDDTHSSEYDSTQEHESNTETQDGSTDLLGTRCIGPSEPKEHTYQKSNKTFVNSQVQTDDGSATKADLFFGPTKMSVKKLKPGKITTGNKLRWKIVIKRSDHTGSTKNT